MLEYGNTLRMVILDLWGHLLKPNCARQMFTNAKKFGVNLEETVLYVITFLVTCFCPLSLEWWEEGKASHKYKVKSTITFPGLFSLKSLWLWPRFSNGRNLSLVLNSSLYVYSVGIQRGTNVPTVWQKKKEWGVQVLRAVCFDCFGLRPPKPPPIMSRSPVQWERGIDKNIPL